jgi:excisionase family DNA binding protein
MEGYAAMELNTETPRLAWSISEIAKMTGLSEGFVRNDLGRRLPFHRFGRRILVRDEDLRKYLSEGSPRNQTDGREAL